MKRLLVLMSLLISLQGYTQISKGKFMVNGTIYGKYDNENDEYIYSDDNLYNKNYNIYSFSFEPQIDYFIIKNLSVGLTPKMGFTNTIYSKNTSTSEFNLGGGISVIKYFGAKKILPFIGLSAGISKENNKFTGNIMDSVNDETYLGTIKGSDWYQDYTTKVGIVYFVNKQVGINFLMKYTYKLNKSNTMYNYTSKDEINNLYSGIGISILL